MTYIPAYYVETADIVRRPDRCRIVATSDAEAVEIARTMEAREGRLVQVTIAITAESVWRVSL